MRGEADGGGNKHSVTVRVLLAVAVLLGSLAGGWSARQWQARLPPAQSVLRCFAGGLLMGWGSLLIPGGNDGLILLGMPLLWPYAWASVITMGAVIASAMWVQKLVGSRVNSSPAPREADET